MITISSKRFRELSSELAAAEWILAHTTELEEAINLAKNGTVPVATAVDEEGEIYVVRQFFDALNQQAIEDALPDPPAPPVLSSLSPATAVIGDAAFDMSVIGTGFTAGSVIHFNGLPEPTDFVSETEVKTGINMPLWVNPAVVPVTVANGASFSNELTFEFTAPVLRSSGFGEESPADKLAKLKKK